MSLIHFRGTAILPPLIEETDHSSNPELATHKISEVELEEEKLLSAAVNVALNIILPGIDKKYVNCNFGSGDCSQKNLDTDDNQGESFGKMDAIDNELSANVTTNVDHSYDIDEEMITLSNAENPVSEVQHIQTPDDPITSASSDIESGICSDSINIGDTQSTMTDSYQKDDDTSAEKQCSESTTHLDDYLTLLTNRSCYNLYGSMERTKSVTESDSMESGNYLGEAMGNVERNSKSPSNGSSRSVGSTYMDGYLGQLTDSSWIEYPTESISVHNPSTNKKVEQIPADSPNWSTSSQNPQRKLQFISADSFFNRNSSIRRSTSIPNQLSNSTSGNNKKSNSPNLPDLSASTDINSSIFDKDMTDSMLDESFKSFAGSDRDLSLDDNSLNTVVTGPASETEVSEQKHSDASITIKDGICASDTATTSFISTNIINSSKNNSYNTENESQQYDVNENNDIQQPDLIDLSNFLQTSEVPEEDMADSRMEAYVTVNCSNSIELMSHDCAVNNTLERNDDSEFSTLVHQKMLEVLQSKHAKELQILRRKHDEEIQQLNANFHKLSFEQMKELESCIMKNDSMENIFDVYNQLTCDEESADTDTFARGTFMSSSSSMPSFFLHSDNAPDVSSAELTNSERISKLFSPSRSPQFSSSTDMNMLLVHQTNNQSGHPEYQSGYSALRMREIYHRDAPLNMLSPIKEMSTSEVLEAQLSYYKHLETGLDLVPAREKDLIPLKNTYKLTPSVLSGICKFQAIVRGRLTRKLMTTEKVKQLLSTLMEISKLANQFHNDIMSDNIERGDVNLHKALFNEERTTRQKLWQLLVELPSSEQIKIIRQDVALKHKLNERLASGHKRSAVNVTRPICRSASMPLPQNNKRNQAETRKTTRLRLPQKISVSARSIDTKTTIRRGSSLPPKVGRGTTSSGATRNQSSSPGRDQAKRQPLSPRKNVAASNLPIRQRVKSTSFSENISCKTGPPMDKIEVPNKAPKFTGPISRPCNQKNSCVARKPWR